MKVAVAIDSFKGSLSSMAAGNAAMEGIKRVYPEAQVWVRPLADGGEGTVETLAAGLGGRLEKIMVTGPLGEPVECTYAIVQERTAVIEMAGAAGLPLVLPGERNPLHTTTYGVGEVILDAVKKGCRSFLVGIGGSATNDGGIGMLQALGFEFSDENGAPAGRGAAGLQGLCRIGTENVPEALSECTFQIACDVDNPLCGERGCSAVFGPQKGADEAMILQMDEWLGAYARLAKKTFPDADADFPGSGAAGGLGFAFRTFLHGQLKPGAEIVLEQTGLEAYVAQADYVITGEGRLDGQTAMGKAPVGVAGLAKRFGKPVLAFAGCLTREAAVCNEKGIDAFFPILRTVTSLEEAMEVQNAAQNMRESVEQVFRVIKMMEERTGESE